MSEWSIGEWQISNPGDLVTCRRQAARLAGLAGLSRSTHTRLVTVVSELSRAMLFAFSGVTLGFAVDQGAADLLITFAGRHRPDGSAASQDLDVACAAARRLLDSADRHESASETLIRLRLRLPEHRTAEDIAGWRAELDAAPADLAGVAVAAVPTRPPAGPSVDAALRASATGVWRLCDNTVSLDRLAQSILGGQGPTSGALESLLDLVHPGDAERVAGGLRAAVADERPVHLEFRIVLDDGAVRTVTMDGGHVVGEPHAIAGICHDVTEHASRQVQKDQRQRQRLEAIGELAGSMAHEINNLLQPIIGIVEILQEDLGPQSPQQDDLAIVLDSARQAAAIIRDVLVFARPSDGGDGRPHPLRSTVETAVRFVRALLPPSVAMECHIADGVEGQTELDTNDMRQVLTNLVTNAAHAMGGAGIVRIGLQALAGPPPLVEVRAGRLVELSIADNGSGIDPAIQALIFEPFFTTKQVGEGTGLGLSVVFGIVRRCGGTITVDSNPGKGSTFRLFLPVI